MYNNRLVRNAQSYYQRRIRIVHICRFQCSNKNLVLLKSSVLSLVNIQESIFCVLTCMRSMVLCSLIISHCAASTGSALNSTAIRVVLNTSSISRTFCSSR